MRRPTSSAPPLIVVMGGEILGLATRLRNSPATPETPISRAERGIKVSEVGGPLANSSRPSRLGLPLFSISTLWSSERVTGSVIATSPVTLISPKLCTRLAFKPVRREFPGLPEAPRMP